MKSKLFAGALALASVVVLLHGTREVVASEFHETAIERITAIDIVRIKNVLRLTAAQQPFWAPVEATLIDISRQQKLPPESEAIFRRINRRAVTIALNGAAVARLAAAARPLVAALDEQQRQIALQIAQEMGLGPVIASLS